MKFIYGIIENTTTITGNAVTDLFVIAVLASIAFVVAWNFVGEIGIRGPFGSLIHWVVRIIVFLSLSYLVILLIKIYNFVVSVPHELWIGILVFIIFILITTGLIYVLFFSEKARRDLTISKNKKNSLAVVGKLIDLYYINFKKEFNCEELGLNKKEEETFLKLEDWFINYCNINRKDEKYVLGYDSIMLLEKYYRDGIGYSTSKLLILLSFITIMITVLLNYNNLISAILIFILIILLVYALLKEFPKK